MRHWEIFEKETGERFDIAVATTAAEAIRFSKASLPQGSQRIRLIAKPSNFDPGSPEDYAAPKSLKDYEAPGSTGASG
jgi:hypothetical protein